MIAVLKILLAAHVVGVTPYCEMPSHAQELPVYPPLMSVTNGKGIELIKRSQPQLEFKDLIVRPAVISTTKNVWWQPATESEAAFALREVFPIEFYNRLLHAFDEHGSANTEVDVAISERMIDVAQFLNEIWGSKWTQERDPMKALKELAKYSASTRGSFPPSCELQIVRRP